TQMSSTRSKVLLGAAAIALAAVGYPAAQSSQPAPAAAPARQAAAAPAAAAGGDRAVIDKYCAGCHNERLKRGDVVLQGIDVNHVGTNAEIWERVARKLRSREMPPPGSPRPDGPTTDAYVASIETALDAAAAAKPNAGRVAVHRLNRNEYANAIR